ncbi:MAG: hypothetical protein PHE89_05660 [Alphaproteobacteria bacterium]|nr:hypothetical protein [Alphaproteobacteria bacterium]
MKKFFILFVFAFLVFSVSAYAQLPQSFKYERIKKYEKEISLVDKKLFIVNNNISYYQEELEKNKELSKPERDYCELELKKHLNERKHLISVKQEAKKILSGYHRIL